MLRSLRAAPLLLLLALPVTACDDAGGGGDVGDQVRVDPGFFAAQRFDCDPATPEPSCPPSICDVDESGNVSNCVPSCNVDQQLEGCTAFAGPDGVDLCAPQSCTVSAPGAEPVCDERCSDDDVTCYVFEFPPCG